MNEHDKQSIPPEESQPEELTSPSEASPPLSDDIDVEGALAAVASLHTLTQDEAESPEEILAEETDEAEQDEQELSPAGVERESEPAAPIAAQPMVVQEDRLLRGQAASVIPAFLLMSAGAVLIFLLTTGGELPSSPVLAGVGLLALGIIFLSRWLTNRSPGSLLGGLLLGSLGGVVLFLGTSAAPGWVQGWPLLLSAPGLALLLSALATSGSRSAGLLGAVLAVAGIAVLLANQVLTEWEPLVAGAWPVALGIGIILLIAPVLRRRRNG